MADLEDVVHRRAADRAVEDREERRIRHGDLLGERLERIAVGFDERLDKILARHRIPSLLSGALI